MVVSSVFSSLAIPLICFSGENQEEITIIESEDNFIKWSGEKVLEGRYVLPDNQHLRIKKGTKIIFKGKSSLRIEGGYLEAMGTEKEPITIKSKNEDARYSIDVIGELSGFYLKNTQVSGGGHKKEETDENLVNIFIKKALAQEQEDELTKTIAAINVWDGGFLYAENCDFHDNYAAVAAEDINTSLTLINRSSFYRNKYSLINFGSQTFNAKYNYWQKDNFRGEINQDGKKAVRDFKDPVIVVPGIMGSFLKEKDGELRLDPIFHTYDDLVESLLEEDEYVRNVNLFIFPYDWEKSNEITAQKLKTKIEEVKAQTAMPKVDILAHSMGGLIARHYVQFLDSDDFLNKNVDQLITMGTPHLGSPKAYLMFESGNFGPTFEEKLIKKIFQQKIEEMGYDNLFEYIHNRPVNSIRELLPIYEYLWDEDTDEPKTYPEDYPRNEFLENLNKGEDGQTPVDYYIPEAINIIGKKGEQSTVSGFEVVDVDEDERWKHGYPDGFDLPFGDKGMIKDQGDQTVPSKSAEYFNRYSTYSYEIDSNHTGLPTNAQKIVIENLTGHKPSKKIDDTLIENMLFISVYSPVDIQVISPSGKKVGKDFEEGETVNEIDMAYYSGFDTEEEFITIPNYEEGEYRIKTQGTGEGEFRIEAVSLNKTDEEGFTEKTEKTVQGEATEGEEQEFSFAVGEEDDQIEEEEDDSDSDESEEDEGSGDQSSDIGDQEEDDSEQSSTTENQDEEDENQESETSHQEEEAEDDSNQSSVISNQDEETQEDESDEDEEENENDGDQSLVTNNQVASEEEENSHQSSVIGDQDKVNSNQLSVIGDQNKKDGDQLSVIGNQNKEGENKNLNSKKKVPSVKGEKTENNPLVIAGILLLGGIALTLTWTVGYQKE